MVEPSELFKVASISEILRGQGALFHVLGHRNVQSSHFNNGDHLEGSLRTRRKRHRATILAVDEATTGASGRITCFDGSTPMCSIVFATTAIVSPSATCTLSIWELNGTHAIIAVFTGTEANFSNSTSPVVNRVVPSTTSTLVFLTSTSNPTNLGARSTLTAGIFAAPPVP